jgi:hypothetical protein
MTLTAAQIETAASAGLNLCKYADPTEPAREGLTLNEALEVAREDASLIYVNNATNEQIAEVLGV